MENSSSFQMIAGLEDLAEIRRYLRGRAAILQIDPSTIYDVLLAVTELVTNTLLYGYQEKSGFIEVEMGQESDSIVVRLRDRAPTFDLTQAPLPDLSLPLDERPIGGLGIFLARQVVNQLTYRSLPQGGNEVTLVFDQIHTKN